MSRIPHLTVLVIAVASAALGACGDGAVGAGYRGERIGGVGGIALLAESGPGVFFPDVINWSTRASITWTGEDGEAVTDEHVVLIMDAERRFVVTFYVEPPERLARAAERGAVVLGQIVLWADLDDDGVRDAGDADIGRPPSLVGWSATGASGGLVRGELAPGMHALAPATRCATAAIEVAPIDVVTVTIELTPPPAFFDPACADGAP